MSVKDNISKFISNNYRGVTVFTISVSVLVLAIVSFYGPVKDPSVGQQIGYQITVGVFTALIVTAIWAYLVWSLTEAREELVKESISETQAKIESTVTKWEMTTELQNDLLKSIRNELKEIQSVVNDLQGMGQFMRIPGSETSSPRYDEIADHAIQRAKKVEFYGITGVSFFRRINRVIGYSRNPKLLWFGPNPSNLGSFLVRANFERKAGWPVPDAQTREVGAVVDYVRAYLNRWLGAVYMACELTRQARVHSIVLYLLDYINLNRYIMTDEYVLYEIFDEEHTLHFPGTHVFLPSSPGYRSLASNSHAYSCAIDTADIEVKEKVHEYGIDAKGEWSIEQAVAFNLVKLLGGVTSDETRQRMMDLAEFLGLEGEGDVKSLLVGRAKEKGEQYIRE